MHADTTLGFSAIVPERMRLRSGEHLPPALPVAWTDGVARSLPPRRYPETRRAPKTARDSDGRHTGGGISNGERRRTRMTDRPYVRRSDVRLNACECAACRVLALRAEKQLKTLCPTFVRRRCCHIFRVVFFHRDRTRTSFFSVRPRSLSFPSHPTPGQLRARHWMARRRRLVPRAPVKNVNLGAPAIDSEDDKWRFFFSER